MAQRRVQAAVKIQRWLRSIIQIQVGEIPLRTTIVTADHHPFEQHEEERAAVRRLLQERRKEWERDSLRLCEPQISVRFVARRA